MATLAAVGGCDDRAALGPPGRDHALDRLRVEVGPVREHDDRRLDIVAELLEAARERRARAALPAGARDDAGRRLERVRSGDHHDVVDGALLQPLEHLGQQQALLRRAEARRLTGGEHDRGDAHDSSTVTDSTTTGRVGVPLGSLTSPKPSMRLTVSIPLVTLPTIA